MNTDCPLTTSANSQELPNNQAPTSNQHSAIYIASIYMVYN